jgi:serine-type D-Ala-D-Ala carboxypeptidase
MPFDTPLSADIARMGAARDVVLSGLAARAYPAALVEVGRSRGPIWREAFGRLTYDAGAPDARLDTVFDLASLTKVIATTSLVMRAIRESRLALDTRVADRLPDWTGDERAPITIGHLLDHSSGLPAHARLWEHARGRAAFERAIAQLPVERTPGTASVYSDVGFILLGFLLEDSGGTSLDRQLAPLSSSMSGEVRYLPPADWRPRVAPTEVDVSRASAPHVDVHDENAAALGGVAGHAGLFGTAGAVGRFAQIVLATFQAPTALGRPEEMRRFATRTGVPGSSRALGWDTMLPTSSCGTRMSPRAIGHTGFTGTSLWIDPEKDVYVVWLTNRVHPTRENDALIALRPKLHDAVMSAISG